MHLLINDKIGLYECATLVKEYDAGAAQCTDGVKKWNSYMVTNFNIQVKILQERNKLRKCLNNSILVSTNSKIQQKRMGNSISNNH